MSDDSKNQRANSGNPELDPEEHSVRAGGNEFLALLTKIPALLHVIDSGGRIVEVSDLWLEVLGYERGEAIGRRSLDFLTEDSRRYVEAGSLPDFLRGGCARDVPCRFVKKNGETINTLLSAVSRRIQDSLAVYHIAVLTNLTGLKQARAEVLDAAKFPLENPNPVLRVSRDGVVLFANRAGSALLNKMGCDAGQPLPERWHRTVNHLFGAGLPGQTEVECAEGHVFLLSVVPILENNYANIYAMDITDRKRVERELHNLNETLERRVTERTAQLDAANRDLLKQISEREFAEQQTLEQANLINLANEAIISRDLEDRVQFWSKGAERFFGWTAREAVGRRLTDLAGLEVGAVERAKRTLIEKGEWMGEFCVRKKGDMESMVESRWTLLQDAEGVPKGILSFCTDITEKKKLEAQFLRVQRLESIGTLASGIAHDINNILAPILMSASVLRFRLRPEEFEKTLATIEGCAQRGTEIIKQLLTFARGISGERMVLQPSHVIKDVVKLARETFPKSISIVSDVAPELHPLLGDPTQLHQVLLNLCVNARDAMPGGGTLSVTAENLQIDEHAATMYPDAQAGPYVVVKVSDTGEGIPAAILDKIFDPFFTTKGQGKGTGLGLSTVLGIVRSHDGFVTVSSEFGQGSVFKVHLPATSEAEAQRLEEKTTALPAGQGELILVVDDEAPIRESTQTILQRQGYNVVTAADGVEGVVQFTQHRDEIRVVLTDIMMPLMDGPTMLRALKPINPGVKVIASSGWSTGLEKIRLPELKELGVDVFLTKPYTAEKLLTTLQESLRGAAL